MNIHVNGERREVPNGCTVRDLLLALELPTEHVAVERNRAIVPRNRHAATVLQADDRLEVVTLVGGG